MSGAYPYGFNPQSFFPSENEVLDGQVQGKKASDIEERFFRAAERYWDGWLLFRQRLSPLAAGGYLEKHFSNLPGELEIDLLIGRGYIDKRQAVLRGQFVQPIKIQGFIGHFYAPWQADADDAKDAQINKVGKWMGWMPIKRVPEHPSDLYRLSNQDLANQTFRSVMGV